MSKPKNVRTQKKRGFWANTLKLARANTKCTYDKELQLRQHCPLRGKDARIFLGGIKAEDESWISVPKRPVQAPRAHQSVEPRIF